LIAGVRPEYQGRSGRARQARLEVLGAGRGRESMGSELRAYFHVASGAVEPSELTADPGMADLPRRGSDAQQVVARLDALSRARPGEQAEIVPGQHQLHAPDRPVEPRH